MSAATWIALWGAGLSTILAVIQLLTWHNARPRLRLNCRTVMLAGPGDEQTRLGGLVIDRRGPDLVERELQAILEVRNVGDKAVQVLAVCIEELQDDSAAVSVHLIEAPPLPMILEPRTSTSIVIQIEYVAVTEKVTFVGVVDALGNKHKAPYLEVRSMMESCWRAETRAKWYRHKQDKNDLVRAFQALQVDRMMERPIRRRPPRVLVQRKDGDS